MSKENIDAENFLRNIAADTPENNRLINEFLIDLNNNAFFEEAGNKGLSTSESSSNYYRALEDDHLGEALYLENQQSSNFL